MRRIRKAVSIILLAVLLSCFFLPFTASAEKSTTLTFSRVVFTRNPPVSEAGVTMFDYPSGSKMATVTQTGNDIVFYIPAIGPLSSDLKITGKVESSSIEYDGSYIKGYITGSYDFDGMSTSEHYDYYDKKNQKYTSTPPAGSTLEDRNRLFKVGKSIVIIWFWGNDHRKNNDSAEYYLYLRNPVETVTQSHTGYAGTDPGEDEGVDFAAIGGGIAVAVGVGVAVSGGKKKNNKSNKKNVGYKMYVYKDFGDGIQKGAPPVRVCARIAQIMEGREYDCPEQTRNIVPSGENLTVRPAGMNGRYMTAYVSADPASVQDSGAVTFTLKGPGGVYTRSVIFRIVGEPSIIFPRDTEDGKWDMSVRDDSVDLIAGLGGREKLRFVIRDASAEPVSIRFSESNGLRVTPEKDTRFQYTYYAVIDNNTPRIEKENRIFAEEEKRQITIYAKFHDGKEISGVFTVNLYPDGLYVNVPKEKKKDGRLLVDTLPEEWGGDWNGAIVIPYTPFDFYITFLDGGGHPVIKKNPSMKHEEKLIDDGKYGNTFKENFTFRIHHAGADGIQFTPDETMPELGEPYYAGMKFSANADGRTFEGLLPLALSGEKPKLPSVVAWEEAYAKLKKDVRYFGLDNDPHLKELIREVRAKNVSASDLEHVRRYLLLCAVSYYQKCNREYEKIDAVMSRYIVVSSAMVKAGDLAIEFLITKVWPKELGGGIFAKFVLPLKDMFCTYVGQRLSFFAGEPERGEFESVSLIGSLTDSVLAALEESITGKMKPDPDTLGYIVAAYIFISFLKHYFGDDPYEKGDIYRSMVAAGKDLTFAKIKAWFAGEISKATGAVFDKIGKFFGAYFKSLCSGSVQKIVNAAGDKAFQASIRESIQGTGGVSTVQYILAKGLKTTAMETEATVQRWIINEGAKNVSEIVGQTTSMAVGTATNLLFGGTNMDGEVYGVTVEDVITGYIAERWKAVCVKVYNMINNPLDSSIRVEDGCLKLGVCGYYIEFPIAENLPVIIDSVFTVCFDWMKSLWDSTFNPPTTVDDLRDRLEKNTEVVEEQVRRLENMKPIEFRKEANYTPWGGGAE